MASLKRYLAARLGPPLIALLIALLSRTLRVVVEGAGHEEAIYAGGRPLILAMWHGRLLYLTHHYRRTPERYRALASPSGDGELVARVLERYGYGVIRGSSYQNPRTALRELKRAVDDGYSAVLIADGSRGPYHKAQPGSVMVSRLTGAPVLPVTVAFSRKWELRSWDRLQIPKPFATVVVKYAPPLTCPREADEARMEELRAELERSLNEITDAADARAAGGA